MRHVCPECGAVGDAGACPTDGAFRDRADTEPLLGTMVGSWRIARVIGTGGMGRVYKAVQPAIGARVAIKVLRREAAADAELVDRFFNEARAVNLIRHESIVNVIDLGRLPDGAPYIIMEFLEGSSLGALFKRHRPFPLGTLAQLVAQVLAALEAAHRKQIIHRDLKADNVIVSPAGRATVLDFGIAKLASFDGTATQSGMLLGTPAYMAPEQARAETVDGRADLYAAGVILYEGATGSLPFAAGSMYEMLHLQVNETPAAPRSRNPLISAALEAVIVRALAKDPAGRFATAAEMRAALLASVADIPGSSFANLAAQGPDPAIAPAPSLAFGETVPSPRPARRHRARRTLAVSIGAALVGAVVAVVLASRGSPPRAPAKPTVVVPPDAAVARAPSPPRVNTRDVQENEGLSTTSFDPFAYYATALARASEAGGAVVPARIEWSGARRDGTIDLTAGGTAFYVFVAPAKTRCVISISMSSERSLLAWGTTTDCTGYAPMTPLACPVATVLRRAGIVGDEPVTMTKIGKSWRLEGPGGVPKEIVDDCK